MENEERGAGKTHLSSMARQCHLRTQGGRDPLRASTAERTQEGPCSGGESYEEGWHGSCFTDVRGSPWARWSQRASGAMSLARGGCERNPSRKGALPRNEGELLTWLGAKRRECLRGTRSLDSCSEPQETTLMTDATTRMQRRLMAALSMATMASAMHCGGQVTSSSGTGGDSLGGASTGGTDSGGSGGCGENGGSYSMPPDFGGTASGYLGWKLCYPACATAGNCLVDTDPNLPALIDKFTGATSTQQGCLYPVTGSSGDCCYLSGTCNGRPLWIEGRLCLSRLSCREDWGA